MGPRLRIGELLIHAGVLSEAQVADALAQQRAQGAGSRRLGAVLVQMNLVTEEKLTRVLSQQLSVPRVSLQHLDLPRELLGLLPRELAEEQNIVPVYIRHERKIGDTLYVATDDPTNEFGLRRVRELTGMPIKVMIATSSEVRVALRAFYGEQSSTPTAEEPEATKTPSRPNPLPPPAPRAPVRRASLQHPSQPTPEALPAAEPSPTPATGAPAALRAPSPTPTSEQPAATPEETPPQGKASGGRMVSLTLLDGTEIKFPMASGPGDSRDDPDARVESLLAELADADLVKVRPVVLAALSILVRKRWITPEELLDAVAEHSD